MSTATELLKEIYADLEYDSKLPLWLRDKVRDKVRAFLAAESEATPVAWMHPNGGVIQTRLTGLERDTYTIPLYTRPESARKPMMEEDAIELCPFTREEFKAGFLTGIRFAEKHHGITE